MGSTELERAIRDRQAKVAQNVGEEPQRARQDAGLSLRALGRATGLDPAHLARVERGRRDPSLDAMVAIATVLGRDVSLRLFESTGPRIRDHVQGRMMEALLGILHPRWLPRPEVPVYRPVSGVIDLVLQDRDTAQLVAGEGHGELQTVEQQLRWAAEKTDALPSATGWPWADVVAPPPPSRLLVLRSTTANRELVRTLPATFRAAYPARTRDAYASLTTVGTPWPGASILWVAVTGARARVLHGPPRGVPG